MRPVRASFSAMRRVAHLFDLAASLRPCLREFLGDADDLGDAFLVDRCPAHPEAPRELGAKGGLVEHARRGLVIEELTAVDREPFAVLGSDLVGDEDVGVELWVGGSGGPVGERGGEEAFGVDLVDTASSPPRERGVLFEESERLVHRGEVCLHDFVGDVGWPNSPERRD